MRATEGERREDAHNRSTDLLEISRLAVKALSPLTSQMND